MTLPPDLEAIMDYIGMKSAGYGGSLKWNEVAKLKADMMNVPTRWRSDRVSPETLAKKCAAVGLTSEDTDLVIDLLRKTQAGRRLVPQRSYRAFQFPQGCGIGKENQEMSPTPGDAFDEFEKNIDRMLDIYDSTASLSSRSEGWIALDVGQILANITELMERFQLDPMVPIGLVDISDAETLYAFFQSGMAEVGVTHIAAESERLLRNDYPNVFPRLFRFDYLDSFDPRQAFTIPDGFVFEPLAVTRTVMRDHLDPSREPQSTYNIDELGAEAISAVMLGSLFAFAAVSNGCRMGQGDLE